MDIKVFQEKAAYFIKDSVKDDQLYFVLGLLSEAGEVADKIKKKRRDGVFELEDFKKELGDVLFYVAAICTTHGFDLSVIAAQNLDKLRDRLNRGVISGSGDNR